MKIKQVNDELEQLRLKNYLLVLRVGLAMAVVTMVSEFTLGSTIRGGVLAFTALVITGILISAPKALTTTYEAITALLVFLIFIDDPLTSGGLTKIEGVVSLAMMVLAYVSLIGLRGFKVGLTMSLGGCALIFLLQHFALLKYTDQPAFEGASQWYVANYFFQVYVLMILCLWMLTSFHWKQRELLRQLAEEYRISQEAESKFLSNMSHEIRNPLNGIIGMLREIESEAEDVDDFGIKYSAQVGLTAGEQLLNIVNDILDLKKIQEGHITAELESVDMWQLAKNRDIVLARLAADKGIKYSNDSFFESMPRYLMVDKQRYNQALMNIIGNAIKFTEEGEVVVTGNYVDGEIVITVRDTGIGMSQETLEVLFDRFKQADFSTAKRFQGTGLGLAITKELVTALGGRIDVESELGVGSTFTLYMPAAVDEARQAAFDAGEVAAEVFPEQKEIVLGGVHVLAVDDNRINLAVVNKILQKSDASVVTAASGLEALEKLANQDFDIIVTDISMPEMDGEELLEQVKNEFPLLPVVAVTGNVMSEDVKRYIAAGFSAVLPKPINAQELLRTIRSLVKK